VLDYPELIGAGVKVVTFEYGKWISAGGTAAADRLDVLGLDRTGRLVVALAGLVGTSSRRSMALLPLADAKPATAPGGWVCVWTSKVTRLHRSCPGRCE
jgi:hypothetical protein